jgi:hypothetical protein
MLDRTAFYIGRLFGYETTLLRDGPVFEKVVKLIQSERHAGGYFHLWVFGWELVTRPYGPETKGLSSFTRG